MSKRYLIAIAITLFAGSTPACADIIEDFTPVSGINLEAVFQAGGGSTDQVVSAIVNGGPTNGANSIAGDSIFVSIDTTNVNPAATGDYGGGVRASTQVIPSTGNPFLASSAATDYDVVFDMASVGYVPRNFDLFLNIRDASNTNLIPQISINQGNPAFNTMAFFGALDGNGTTVPVSIGLENFSGVPANVSSLVNAERFQFTLITRALPGDFTAGPNNTFVLDNLGLITTAAVPEPSSMTLLIASSMCLLGRRRR